MAFELTSHTSEIGFIIKNEHLEGVFDDVCKAFSTILTDEMIQYKQSIAINVKADSLEMLLFNFVDELILFQDVNCVLFSGAEVTISDDLRLTGTIFCDLASNYITHGDVKAPTYHKLKLEKTSLGFIAEMLVDV